MSFYAISPDEALVRLKEGNKRFIDGKSLLLNQSSFTRKKLVSVQNPFCSILACADSRVTPEIVFDQGIGDLFVVRLAGNVASKIARESLEFSTDILGVPLIIVMGHQNCGAVAAVLNHSAELELSETTALIGPSVLKDNPSLNDAVIANVYHQISLLKSEPLLKRRLENKTLKIMGAYYHFESGEVDFFD